MNWYLTVLKKYAVFNFFINVSFFLLFNVIFLIVAAILDNVLGTTIEGVGYGLIYILYALAVLLPGIAVSVRRLHDLGKSGWLLLIVLIPVIGGIWLLVLMCIEGNPGKNAYGANPKAKS